MWKHYRPQHPRRCFALNCKSRRESDPANGVHSECETDQGPQKHGFSVSIAILTSLSIGRGNTQVLNLTFMRI